MRIIDRITGDTYDVLPDEVIEKEYTSPVFSEYGSMSLPFRLAPTLKNRTLLGYPDLFCLQTKANVKRDVILDEDGLHTCATMCLIDANEEEYNVTLGFNDGDAYNKMQNVKLTEMNLPKWVPQIFVQQSPDIMTELRGVDAFVHICARWSRGEYQYNDEFRLFPVLLQRDADQSTNNVYYTIANEPEAGDIFTTRPLLGEKVFKKTVWQDGKECQITFLKGYSIAPYYLVHCVVKKIVEYLGYEVEYNVFEQDNMLNKLCVLHNVMDIGCVEEIDVNQLLPDCTIDEFISSLHARFGAVMFFDSQTLRVRITTIKNMLQDDVRIDLTNYAKTRKITYASPSYLSLTSPTSFGLAGTEKDTLEEFAKKHDYMCNAQEEQFAFANTKLINMRYRRATGTYYMMKKVIGAGVAREYYRVSSNFFDYNKKEKDYEEVSLSSNDEHVSTFCEDKDRLVQTGAVIDLPFVAKLTMPFFDAGAKHINTVYRGTGDADEDGDETPLAFALYRGQAVNYNSAKLGYCYASTQAHDNMGQEKLSAGLHYAGEDGLFEAYWKDYDAMLRHSNHEIECEMFIPDNVFRTIRLDKPVLVNGKRCLISSIKTNTDKSYMFVLKTIDILTPNSIHDEQAIPVLKKQEYYWTAVNYEQDDTLAEIEKIKKKYTNDSEGQSCTVTYKEKSKETPAEEDFKYVANPSTANQEFMLTYKKVLDVTVTVYNNHGSNPKYFDHTMYYRYGLRSVYSPSEL